GRRGINAPKGISGEIPTPQNSPGGEFVLVYVRPLARPLVMRVNLPGGKLRNGVCWSEFAWRQINCSYSLAAVAAFFLMYLDGRCRGHEWCEGWLMCRHA
ncbi:hypothetical protein ACFYN5_34265, partial [Streptomyces sp. NPDC007126]|uniref:hypothetical protein n=1 Tax=Streptomyces sp. NPDC007126 TaxID=3364774 RepID=UPI00368A6EFF